MFARKVFMHLKPNSVGELIQSLEKEIIPLLRKQKGFQDEITFIDGAGTKAFGISLWERPENAEAYNREVYPAVRKILAKSIEGAPQIETFEVITSTFHKVVAPASA
jgi:hypothetical protein